MILEYIKNKSNIYTIKESEILSMLYNTIKRLSLKDIKELRKDINNSIDNDNCIHSLLFKSECTAYSVSYLLKYIDSNLKMKNSEINNIFEKLYLDMYQQLTKKLRDDLKIELKKFNNILLEY